jgi:hypothetical protein
MVIECRPGTPETSIECSPGGPNQIKPICLACGPDSPIACGAGGPDTIVNVDGCLSGPMIDIRVNPGMDPKKLILIDLNKIPKNMKTSIENMLKKMAEER